MSVPDPAPASAARSLRGELRRLGRGFAHRVGRSRARRWHLLLLLALAALAFVSRAIVPVPGLSWLHGEWGYALAVAALLLALGPVLSFLFGALVRPAQQSMAYDLDDRLDLRDQAGTAAETLQRDVDSPLVEALRAHAADRLRRTDEDRLWKGAKKVPYVRAFLVLLFVFFLVGPGVDGLLGDRGVGRGDEMGLGPRDTGTAPGKPRPMKAGLWMAWFAQDPLHVESLQTDGPPLPEAKK